jgi:hypothetical protein
MIPGLDILALIKQLKASAKDPATQAKADWVLTQLGTPEARKAFLYAVADACRRAADEPGAWGAPGKYLCQSANTLQQKDPATTQALGLDPAKLSMLTAGAGNLRFAASFMGVGSSPEEKNALAALQNLADLMMVVAGTAMQNRIDTLRQGQSGGGPPDQGGSC